jgi:excisionase family DNA binding protein
MFSDNSIQNHTALDNVAVIAKPGDLLNTSEAMALLGVSKNTLFRMMGDGALPFVKLGRHRKIARAHVAALAATGWTRKDA